MILSPFLALAVSSARNIVPSGGAMACHPKLVSVTRVSQPTPLPAPFFHISLLALWNLLCLLSSPTRMAKHAPPPSLEPASLGACAH